MLLISMKLTCSLAGDAHQKISQCVREMRSIAVGEFKSGRSDHDGDIRKNSASLYSGRLRKE